MNILTTRSRFTRINMCSSCAHEHASCTPAMSYNLASRKLSYGWQKTRLGERAENIYGQTSGKGLPKNAERQEITMIYFLVVGPGGVPRQSNFNVLRLQTSVSARIERKGAFGAVTNQAAGGPSKPSLDPSRMVSG
jgi:hypothetical protein